MLHCPKNIFCCLLYINYIMINSNINHKKHFEHKMYSKHNYYFYYHHKSFSMKHLHIFIMANNQHHLKHNLSNNYYITHWLLMKLNHLHITKHHNFHLFQLYICHLNQSKLNMMFHHLYMYKMNMAIMFQHILFHLFYISFE